MKKIILITLATTFMYGCTTVKHNGADIKYKNVNYPEIGKTVTAYVGDNLVQKGKIVEEKVLVVNSMIDGALYDIPAQAYKQIGFDSENDFYNSTGVIRNPFADPFKALSLNKKGGSELCVVTVFGGSACYEGDFQRSTRLAERSNSFQQTLIYSGRIDNKINISYREFSNNMARPAFNNDVEYDLSDSKQIGYKGAVIEVLKADNKSITYRLITNFR